MKREHIFPSTLILSFYLSQAFLSHNKILDYTDKNTSQICEWCWCLFTLDECNSGSLITLLMLKKKEWIVLVKYSRCVIYFSSCQMIILASGTNQKLYFAILGEKSDYFNSRLLHRAAFISFEFLRPWDVFCLSCFKIKSKGIFQLQMTQHIYCIEALEDIYTSK